MPQAGWSPHGSTMNVIKDVGGRCGGEGSSAILQGLKLDRAGDKLLQGRKSSAQPFHPSSQLTEGEVDVAVARVLAAGGITSGGAGR